MGRGFLTLVVAVLGKESCRHCRRKQKKESGLWETAAPAGRELRGSESRREEKAKVYWAVFQGPEATMESSL